MIVGLKHTEPGSDKFGMERLSDDCCKTSRTQIKCMQ